MPKVPAAPFHFSLGRAFRLRYYVPTPLRRVLRWGGLLRKSSARLARKQYAVSVLPPPCPPRARRRVRAQNLGLPLARSCARALKIAIPAKSNRDPWKDTLATGVVDKAPLTLKISITDLYQATSRALAGKDITDEDRAFQKKLEYAYNTHELIAGVKVVEKQIQAVCVAGHRRRAEQYEREAKRLIDIDRRRHEEEKTLQAQRSKKAWSRLVKAAHCGRKVRTDAPAMHIARWNWYEAYWAVIQSGELKCSIPFNHMPWPTLNPDRLEVEDYEAFILSPARPRFETRFWFERVEVERQRWALDNVEKKVLPLVDEEIRERVLGCARILLRYLELLVDKYNTCD
ncbi:hypothetical protein V5O48_003096 [Marasmius crinis-equi]|uniref:Uncharacterized protein n=1 Tax=Marasmius crinis-equi TaxID=585013 RepID=A0ABR3FTS3_9AGAR